MTYTTKQNQHESNRRCACFHRGRIHLVQTAEMSLPINYRDTPASTTSPREFTTEVCIYIYTYEYVNYRDTPASTTSPREFTTEVVYIYIHMNM